MAARAPHARDALILHATPHRRLMDTPLVADARRVILGMAIEASWVGENAGDIIKVIERMRRAVGVRL
jgi:hypothetical protein